MSISILLALIPPITWGATGIIGTKMGVSAAFPLSTAGQIVCNALMAAAVLGEWTTLNMWFFGIISIALVTVGALLTAARSKAEKKTAKKRPSTYMQGLFALLLSTIGFMLYFVFPNLLVKVGFISERIHNANNGINYMTAIVTPQAVGQVIGSALIGYFILHEKQLLGKPTFKNLVTGINWGIGNLFMFISAANPAIGQATATTLSQLGIVVGTFGGIYILHERKTPDQMVKIVLGSVLVIIGSILITNLKLLSL